MGLNIRDIIPRKEIEITELKDKILCVDAFNVLYQFLSTIRQYDGTPLMDEQKKNNKPSLWNFLQKYQSPLRGHEACLCF